MEYGSESWNVVLKHEAEKSYMLGLQSFLRKSRASGKKIYPPEEDTYNCLKLTPFNEVKVVILGQDPYHGEGQAHGLAFSVKEGQKIPPSLKNIFKELKAEFPDYPLPANGDLSRWARQGVLLLNTTLTVEAGEPGSHNRSGWTQFTDRIISSLSEKHTGIVFMLWGRPAQLKTALIDPAKHHILKAAHPSPLSAHQGFFGCGHFKKANEILAGQGVSGIEW